jgi:hypothetical protein
LEENLGGERHRVVLLAWVLVLVLVLVLVDLTRHHYPTACQCLIFIPVWILLMARVCLQSHRREWAAPLYRSSRQLFSMQPIHPTHLASENLPHR